MKFDYILRYYLPCEPIYDKSVTENRGEELIEFCRTYGINSVMLYVELNPYWYYSSDSVEHNKYYVGVIKELSEKLRKNSISYQLNYQNLVGAWDGNADLRYVTDVERYVDQYGREAYATACATGEKFKKVAGEKLKLWAETKPDVIWIDDDIRFFLHRTDVHEVYSGKKSEEEWEFGCFCDNCIAKFNKVYSLNCTREEIHKGILENGELRKKWIDFSGEQGNELARWIENTIHSVSPETKIAVMTSAPDMHSVEGRKWDEFLKKLSGNFVPALRPHYGPYCEKAPQDFFSSYLISEQLKANIKCEYKGDFEFYPEVENTRFSVWSKSLSATKYQILLSAFLGCKGITLSLFDLEGGMLFEYSEFGELIKYTEPFSSRLLKEELWKSEDLGIGLITAPDRVCEKENKKVGKMLELSRGRMWDETLAKTGLPCRYITPYEINNAEIIAVDGFTVGLLRDSEILSLLSKKVIADSGATAELQKRGFGEYLGVTAGEKMTCIAATEAFSKLNHSDGSKMRLPLRIDGGKWNKLDLQGAEVLSSFVTPCGENHIGTAVYENSLGGKIYTTAANGSLGDGFFSTYRMLYLKNMISYENKLPKIDNKSYTLFSVKRMSDKYTLFIANMNADVYKNPKITLPFEVTEATVIFENGEEYTPLINNNEIICQKTELALYGCVSVIIKRK